MNILMLNYEFPPIGGGASPVSRDLGRELVKLGHQITVVTMGFHQLPSHEIMDGMNIYRVRCIRTKAFVCHPWEQFSYLISSYFCIKKMLKTQHFDLVHAHFIIPTGVLALWLKRKYGIHYVITAHGSDVMGYNQRRFRILHKFLLKPWKCIVSNSDNIVSPSKFLDDLIRKQLPNARSTIIPNGVDTQCFKALPKEKIILVLCRLQETKNVQTVIKAISLIPDMQGYKLYIAGDGPYKAILENLVHDLRLQNRIEFLGWIENKSLRHVSLVGKAAIYISASRFENSPISVLEAISAECHPLLSDIPPHRLLIDNYNYLFDTNDERTLAKKIEKLIDDIQLGTEFHISKPIDWTTVSNQYNTILETIVPNISYPLFDGDTNATNI